VGTPRLHRRGEGRREEFQFRSKPERFSRTVQSSASDSCGVGGVRGARIESKYVSDEQRSTLQKDQANGRWPAELFRLRIPLHPSRLRGVMLSPSPRILDPSCSRGLGVCRAGGWYKRKGASGPPNGLAGNSTGERRPLEAPKNQNREKGSSLVFLTVCFRAHLTFSRCDRPS